MNFTELVSLFCDSLLGKPFEDSLLRFQTFGLSVVRDMPLADSVEIRAANSFGIGDFPSLERKPCAELQFAGLIGLRREVPEARRIQGRIWSAEIDRVDDVEGVGLDRELQRIVNRNLSANAYVDILGVRSKEVVWSIASSVSICVGRRIRECRLVEEVGGAGGCSRCRLAILPYIPGKAGRVVRIAGCVDNAASGARASNGQGSPGSKLIDSGELPVADSSSQYSIAAA